MFQKREEREMKKLFASFKKEAPFQDVLLWFGCGFAGVLAVFVIVMKRQISDELFLETLGYALVLAVLIAMTRVYGKFIDEKYLKIFEPKNNGKGGRLKSGRR